jgi:hypothetical protein
VVLRVFWLRTNHATEVLLTQLCTVHLLHGVGSLQLGILDVKRPFGEARHHLVLQDLEIVLQIKTQQ